MLEFLQTGKALYVLAAICGLGVLTKWITRNLYKRLIKETDNMILTKNKNLRAFKQKAETTYQMNQGIPKVRPYLERQMYDFTYMGIPLGSYTMFSNQMTLWCFLIGGAAAFASYWYRTDSYYIVLYGSVGILAGLFTILTDHAAGIMEKKQQLFAALENYMENTLLHRLEQDKNPRQTAQAEVRENIRTIYPTALKTADQAGETDAKQETMSRRQRARAERAKNQQRVQPKARMETEPETVAAAPPEESEAVGQETKTVSRRDVDYLKRSLEQIAASRERDRIGRTEEDLLKDLNPEELKLIGEILHEYLT